MKKFLILAATLFMSCGICFAQTAIKNNVRSVSAGFWESRPPLAE